MGLECAIITCLWVGGQSVNYCANALMFVHGELVLGILCSRWYAIENVWGSVFLSFLRYYFGILHNVRCSTV